MCKESKNLNLQKHPGVFNRQAGQMFKRPDTGHELEFVKIIAAS